MENISILRSSLEALKIFYKKDEIQILDPFSSIVRIAILSFMERGTKISISNNRIYFQSPSLIQGALRWGHGDTRADLHNLCNPIEKGLEWYKNNIHVMNILEYTIEGIRLLKEQYGGSSSNLVAHSLNYYIFIIENKLQRMTDDDLAKSISNIRILGNTEIRNIDALKSAWDINEMEVIYKLINMANINRKENKEYMYLIETINMLLLGKDKNLEKIIYGLKTTL